MITTITSIGNSQGIRIPKLLLNESELGETVELVVKKGEIRILAASKKQTVKDTLVLSEEALGVDWNKSEEDKAWQSLQ
jgi:antitoxin component of MazEF toxin-antitoxin module